MAARSRAIESRLERLAPALEEFYVAGIVTLDERNLVARTRLTHEYKLVARPLLAADVRRAIDFEQGLEDKIAAYTAGNKVQLKHRWAVLDRIESLFLISIPRLRDAEQRALEDDFIAFLRRTGRNDALSRYLAEKVAKFPQEPRYWCLASEWESEIGNADHARATIQRAVELLPSNASVWICAVHVELEFVARALAQIRADSANKGKKAAVLRAENAALGGVLLDLVLAQTVQSAALASSAFSHDLLAGLVDVALRVPFGWPLAVQAVRAALESRPERCAAGVADAVFKVASQCEGACDPTAFIEGVKRQTHPSQEAGIFAIDLLAVRCPSARAQVARVLLRLFPASPAPAIASLVARRFVSGDWADDAKQVGESLGVSSVAVDAVSDLLACQLPTGASTIDSALVAELKKQGVCNTCGAAAAVVERIIAGDDTAGTALPPTPPRDLENWQEFVARILLGAHSRKQRDRPDSDSDSDSDSESNTRPPVFGARAAVAGFHFLASNARSADAPWRRAAIEEAAKEFAKWGAAAALAEAARTTVVQAARLELSKQSVSVLSKALDGVAVLVSAVEPLTVGGTAAVRTELIPFLRKFAEASSGSLQQRAVALCRRCFDIVAGRDKSIVQAYAAFEIEVAKRPDLAASVRRRLR